MSEHGWTRHGRCCDEATGPRPPRTARCGGPVLCPECAADAAVRHAPATGLIKTPLDEAHRAAAVDSAYAAGVAAGRAQAAADIRAHADKWAPADGNFAQRRLRRHLDIAERVAAGRLTAEEVARALNEYFGLES